MPSTATSKPDTTAYLTSFEASVCLQDIYKHYLDTNRLKDTERPNWYSILTENRRDPLSLSALKKGCPRGNRAAYGQIRIFKFGSIPYYLKADLEEWFTDNFESVIFDRSEAA